MATGSVPSTSPVPPSDNLRDELAGYEPFIDAQIDKARRYVRWVDIATSLATLAAFVLLYLLAMSIADHWLLRGGFGFWGRFIALSVLLVAVIAYAVQTILPHLRYRVNSTYVADAIERAEPSLKNSLLNFLMLRRNPSGVPTVVYAGVQQQAAAGLSRTSTDLAVDRSRLIRGGYALVAVLLACALYKVLSPKDPFPSIARVVAPWADVEAVTRVKIRKVTPGDTEATSLSRLTVTAEVRGLQDDEHVTLIYSSDDQQAVDVTIPMVSSETRFEYTCLLPDDSSGLSDDLQYRIEAGDCVSPTYSVKVVASPTIQVREIEYRYPAYTELTPRVARAVGDIQAIDGTEVIVRAEASQEIAQAVLVLDGLQSERVTMRTEGRAASCRLTLRRKQVGEDSVPVWTSYQILLTTQQGRKNERPIRHRIEITRDQRPIVEILKPQKTEVELPLDGTLYIQVRARDPDFRLGGLWLAARKDSNELFRSDLVKHETVGGKQLDRAHRATFRFVPSRYSLNPGDVVHYSAIAEDNKSPDPNRSATAEYRILITPAERRPDELASNDPETEDRQNADGADDEDRAGGKGGSEGGQSGGGSQGGGEGEESDSGEGGEGSGSSEAGDSESQETSESSGSGKGDDTGESDQESNEGEGGDSSQGGTSHEGTQPSETDPTAGEGEESPGGENAAGRQEGSRRAESEEGTSDEPIETDGDAFREAIEHMENDQKAADRASEGQSRPDQSDDRESSSGEPGPSDKQSSDSGGLGNDQSDAGKPDTENTREGSSKDGSGESNRGESPSPGEGDDGNTESGEGASSEGSEKEGSEHEGPENEGAESGGAKKEGDQDDGDKADSPSDGGSRKSQTDGGGGMGSEGSETPPPPEGEGRQNEKTGSPKDSSEANNQPGESSVSPHESDSAESDESGTRSGQGAKGGGQQSNQAGEGADGSHTPADAGGNASEQPGKGESSDRPGEDAASDSKTGSKGDQPGNASDAGEGQEGNTQPSDGPSRDAESDQAPSDSQPQEPSSEPGSKGSGSSGTQTSPSGSQGDTPGKGLPDGGDHARDGGSVADVDRAEPGADEANLEYARKQTDLVLDYLQDQLDRGGIDPELKKKFGWTDKQFADFVQRYGNLRRSKGPANAGSASAQQELDETLRSLGLRRSDRRVRTGNVRPEKVRGLGDSNRTRPPQEYEDPFDAFRRDAFR